MTGDVAFGLIVGLAGGFLGGMFGVGGGAIYVPAMVLVLDTQQHVAQGVSLAVIIATALVGAATHFRQGNVDTRVTALVAPAAMVAAVGGALAANQIDAEALRRVFGFVVLYIGASMLIGTLRLERRLRTERRTAAIVAEGDGGERNL